MSESLALPIRTIIVDDEPLARHKIARLLAREPDVQIVAECEHAGAAVQAVEAQSIDLVFLDVQMPGGDGFDVIAALEPSHMPMIVFVTAYDEHAIRAFEVNALDYLLKPVDPERVARAVTKARAAMVMRAEGDGVDPAAGVRRLLAQIESQRSRYQRRILVRAHGRIFFLRVEEIDWLEAADNYIRIHTPTGTHLIRERLSAMENRLDPDQFLRIHRSVIVNVDRIKELVPWTSGEYLVFMRNGTQLKLSRGFRANLEAHLNRARGVLE